MVVLPYLLKIIEEFGLFGIIKTSSSELANLLSISPKSVYPILIDLEQQNYITTNSTVENVEIEFREKSFLLLKHTYNLLHKFFSDFVILGKVKKGIGEGRYYVKLPGYHKKFIQRLDINPFPGTLNLQVDRNKIKAMKLFFDPVRIEGFTTKDRTFGSLDCYKCTINDKSEGWVIFAERTTHKDNIIEIISEEEIKKVDDKVKITFVKNCK